MKTIPGIAASALLLLLAAVPAHSAEQAVQTGVISTGTTTKSSAGDLRLSLTIPANGPRFAEVPVATVNDDVITVRQLMTALAASHAGREESGSGAGMFSYRSMLDRIINIRLIAQEAVTIGLNELPEFKEEVKEKERKLLTAMVMRDIVKDVTADAAAVEKEYKPLVVEWKVKSVLFEKEDEAKAMAAAIKDGKSFDDLAKAARDEKKAVGGEQGEFLKPGDLNPGVAALISTMKVGDVSPVIKLNLGPQQGFAVLRLEESRYPENAEARQRAEQAALIETKNNTLAEYKKELYKKYVRIKEKRLARLDYDSPKANMEKLLSDKRVLVKFKDGKTITVGGLTKALQDKFFHGLEQAAKDKYVNKAKQEVLDRLIEDRLIRDEGVRRGIEQSDEFRDRKAEMLQMTLFGLFLEHVIAPDVVVSEKKLQSYYEDHRAEYTVPEMVRVASLDFENKDSAEAALDKLKHGTDINWVRANAGGYVPPPDTGGASGTRIVTVKSLPPELSGAGIGDSWLTGGSGDRFTILYIQEFIPARQRSYEEVSDEVLSGLRNDIVVKAMEDWFQKLRAAADIKVYLAEPGT